MLLTQKGAGDKNRFENIQITVLQNLKIEQEVFRLRTAKTEDLKACGEVLNFEVTCNIGVLLDNIRV